MCSGHGSQQRCRRLEITQFEAVRKSRIPRSNCSEYGVKAIAVLWGERHSRFTLIFEAFVVDTLDCSRGVTAAELRWGSAHTIIVSAFNRRQRTVVETVFAIRWG